MGLAAVYSFSYGQRINTAEISRINFYDPRRPMVYLQDKLDTATPKTIKCFDAIFSYRER